MSVNNTNNYLLFTLALSCCFIISAAAPTRSNSLDGAPSQYLAATSLDNDKQQLNPLATMSAKKHKYNQLQDKKLRQQDEIKEGLRKKWHRIVDEIIENELSPNNNPQQQQQQQQPVMMMVNQPVARRRQPVAPAGQQSASLQASDEAGTEEDKILLLVKRKPALNLSSSSSSSSSSEISPTLLAMNHLDAGQQQQQQQPNVGGQRLPANMMDHQRRILNDGFSIMKESIFSTNNHLGHKEVPKFGSDEQF